MITLKRSQAVGLNVPRQLQMASAGSWNGAAVSRSLAVAKRRRERILACLALLMLIVAWDATLRLDERVSPPRMRMTHAVEMEGELQTMTSVE